MQAVVKAHSKVNGKGQISTLSGSPTRGPPFNTKSMAGDRVPADICGAHVGDEIRSRTLKVGDMATDGEEMGTTVIGRLTSPESLAMRTRSTSLRDGAWTAENPQGWSCT